MSDKEMFPHQRNKQLCAALTHSAATGKRGGGGGRVGGTVGTKLSGTSCNIIQQKSAFLALPSSVFFFIE